MRAFFPPDAEFPRCFHVLTSRGTRGIRSGPDRATAWSAGEGTAWSAGDGTAWSDRVSGAPVAEGRKPFACARHRPHNEQVVSPTDGEWLGALRSNPVPRRGGACPRPLFGAAT